MKKILALVLAAAMLCAAYCAPAEEAGTKITGNIEDGCYVLTVSVDPEDEGEWRVDDTVEDQSVVKLAAAETEDDLFTARYEPAGDGTVTVSLRHYSEFRVCDELHTFELKVENGKVTEAASGSFTASPSEDDMDPYFSGEWLEKDTQFTTLNVTKKAGDGWDIEFTSPLSHGAWVIRATAYFDCDYDAFVYADGVKYDLVPGDEVTEKETDTGLWGTLKFAGIADSLQLEWNDLEYAPEGKTVLFERGSGLPEGE